MKSGRILSCESPGVSFAVSVICGLVILQCAYIHVAAESIFIDPKGNSHLLDGYEAHYQFILTLESIIEEKVKETLQYALQYTQAEPGYFLSDIDSISYSFLQLFHSILSKDFQFSNFLLSYFKSGNLDFTDWFDTKINLPNEHVYEVIKHLSQGRINGLKSIPNQLLEEFIKMNSKYRYFQIACSRGDKGVVDWAIQSGIRLDQDGLEALEAAWQWKHWDIVKMLIQNRSFPSTNITSYYSGLKNEQNETLLHFAADTGSLKTAKSLLKAGAMIDALDIYNRSSLQRAIERKRNSMVEIFLTNGANINHETAPENSLLHKAALVGNFPAVKLLTKEGLPFDRKNENGFTPLHIAERVGVTVILNQLDGLCADFRQSKESIFNLLEIRFQLKTKNVCITEGFNCCKSNVSESVSMLRNLTNIIKFLRHKGDQSGLNEEDKKAFLFVVIENKVSEAVQFLLATGIESTHVSIGLIKAASKSEVLSVKYLLEAGADLSVTDSEGLKPIHIAASNGNVDTVKFLLDSGDDVNSKTTKNRTVLYIAALEGQSDVVKLLIGRAANINLQDSEGWKPIHAAAWKGQYDTLKLLLEKGANVNSRNIHNKTALFEAAQKGFANAVKLLLDNGAYVNSVAEGGFTSLHAAVWGGNPQVVLLLLNRGVNINAKDIYNKTALFVASYYGITPVVKVLLERGADLNIVGVGDWTPLHVASRGGFTEIVNLLLDNGANVNAKTSQNDTPLILAALHGHKAIAQALLAKGADVNVVNKSGENALNAARKRHYGNVAVLLISNGAIEIK